MRRKRRNPSIKVGDRVAYSAAWLRSTGQQAGEAGHARGVVTKIDAIGHGTDPLVLATVRWNKDMPPRVNVRNLARVGGAGFAAMNPGTMTGAPGKRLPPGVDGTTRLRSRGHIKFSGPHEYFRAGNGDIYRASISDVMDMDTGQRAGRFEATATAWKRLPGSNPMNQYITKWNDGTYHLWSPQSRRYLSKRGFATLAAAEKALAAIYRKGGRVVSNPRTRWGQMIRKGAHVSVARPNGPPWHGVYQKLEKPSDFSRAYGRQAVVKLDSGAVIGTALNDLTLATGSNPRYAGKYVGTISARMPTWLYGEVQDAIGRILPIDIGKQVFDVGGVIQVESNEQRDRRMGKNPRGRKSDLLRNMERPTVLGYELDKRTLTPKRSFVDVRAPGDYGADPIGDGRYRMVPSGDIVTADERNRRLGKNPRGRHSKRRRGAYRKNPSPWLPKQMRNAKVGVERGHVYVDVGMWRDWPIQYHDGRIVYDSPGKVPAYAKAMVRKAFKELKG